MLGLQHDLKVRDGCIIAAKQWLGSGRNHCRGDILAGEVANGLHRCSERLNGDLNAFVELTLQHEGSSIAFDA